MRQLFVDLDGVLADFDAGYEAAFGRRPEKKHDPEFWDRVKEYVGPSGAGFYRHLPLMPDAFELWDGVNLLPPRPVILTGIPHPIPEAAKDKRSWVKDYLDPQAAVITCFSADKWTFAYEGDILIDDWDKYQSNWESVGGIFILHTSAEDSLRRVEEILRNDS